MDSPWQVPLPQQDYSTSRVVVYFGNKGSWIPISFYPLSDAIALHRMGLSSGMDIVVFPPDLDPRIFDFTSTNTYSFTVQQARKTQALTNQYSLYATRSTGR